MKPTAFPRRFLEIASCVILATSFAHGATYYWDQNGTAIGFGTAGGTWDAIGSSTWNATAAGDVGPIVSTTTTTADGINFGTASAGLASGTIAVGTVDSGNMIFGAASGDILLSGGTINLTAASTITVNNASANVTISSTLTGAATSFVKNGSGTLTLSGANTFAGYVNIAAGTLNVGAAQAGAIGPLGGSTGSGGLVFTGGTLQYSAANQTDYSARLSSNANAQVKVDVNGQAVTWAGMGTGSASFTLTSTAANGVFTLSGANTYTGGTTVTSGTLKAGVNSTLGGSGAAQTITNGATGTGLVTVNSTLDVSTFALAVGGLSGNGTIGSSSTTTNGSLTIVGPASTQTYSGAIVDVVGSGTTTISLTKSGAGTQVLSGTNTYTGGTTSTGGALVAATTAALPGYNIAGKVVFNGGTIGAQVGGSGWTTSQVDTLLSNASKTSGALGIDTTNGSLTQWTAFNTTNLGSALGLNKLGTGTLILDQANTYAGQTIVTVGTLQLGNGATAGSLNTGSSINIASGATFALNQSDGVSQGVDFGSIIGGAGSLDNVGTGTLVLNAPTYHTGNTSATIGNITLSHALAIQNSALNTTGSGFVTLSGITTPTFGGLSNSGTSRDLSTVISSGYSGVTNLTLNPQTGLTYTYGGVIANGAAGMSLTKTGAGTQVLQGANTYSGATNLNAGTLTLGGAAGALASTSINFNGGGLTLDNATNSGVRVSDSATINVNGNSALTFSHAGAASTNYTETIGALSLQSGFLTYTGSRAASGQTSNLSFSTLSRSGTATVNFSGTSLGADSRNTIKFGAGVTNGVDLGPWAVVNGADFASYSTANGIVAATSSTLAAGSNSATTNFNTTAGSVTITAALNPSYKTLLVTGGTARTTGINSNTVSVGGISSTGATHIISGLGAVQALNAGDALYINVGANALTFSSVIQNVSAGATASVLVKSGAGTLTLGGANTYSGGTVINAGTLSTSADGNLGLASAGITFNGAATWSPGTVTYANRNITINNRSIVTFDAGNSVHTGNVTGTGGIAISNSFGSQHTFNGAANAFEGPVLIGLVSGTTGQAYRVIFASLADSGTANGNIRFLASSVTHNDGSVFEYTGSSNLTIANRQFELASATANPTNGHQIRSSGSGTIRINTDLLVSTAAAQTLALRGANTGDNNFAGVISNGRGTVSVIKADAGKWILSGVNTYTGTTTVSAGTLEIQGSIAGSSGISNSSALVFNNATTQSYGNGISGSGTLSKNGIGTLILSGTNTYNGTTTVNAGVLNTTKAAALAGYTSAAKVIINGGTLGMQVGGAGAWTTGEVDIMLTNATKTSGAVGIDTTNGSLTQWTTFAGGGNFGALGLNKLGTNTLTLDQTNSYTGSTTVTAGTLAVNGTGAINSSSGVTINGGEFHYSSSVGLTRNVTVSTGGIFRYNSTTAYSVGTITNNGGSVAGSGNLGTAVLGGTGSIDPGNSPGILTAGSTDTTGGLDYNFEMTAANTMPTWSNATLPLNDVLRLTGATPFGGNMDADNVISVYFGNGVTPTAGDVFTGGFFTDNNADFLTAISSATFQYFVYNGVSGTLYNGVYYNAYAGPAISVSTLQVGSADFAGGTVTNGYVTQFTVIPEPTTALLGCLGLLLVLRRRR